MNRQGIAVMMGLMISLAGSGCGGGYTKTVRVEERVQPAESSHPSERVAAVTETTTTVRQPAPHRGLLSTTVHFIGEVLALPFRLVGGLLRALF